MSKHRSKNPPASTPTGKAVDAAMIQAPTIARYMASYKHAKLSPIMRPWRVERSSTAGALGLEPRLGHVWTAPWQELSDGQLARA
jgi:hypothetical protein